VWYVKLQVFPLMASFSFLHLKISALTKVKVKFHLAWSLPLSLSQNVVTQFSVLSSKWYSTDKVNSGRCNTQFYSWELQLNQVNKLTTEETCNTVTGIQIKLLFHSKTEAHHRQLVTQPALTSTMKRLSQFSLRSQMNHIFTITNQAGLQYWKRDGHC
jgi:hypothetical protein